MNEISITVPMDTRALQRASDMLLGLVMDLEAEQYGPPEAHTGVPPGESAATAAGQGTAQPAETTENPAATVTTGGVAQSAAAQGAPTDQHGVAFDANYCAQAKEPFYASGSRSGQWKKRKGVGDDTYDAWYASQLAKAPAATDPDPAPEQVNTAGAFTPQAQQQQQQQPAAPQNTGDFMAWVAEKQAAGHLTQDAIQAAYAQAGIAITDLFPPNTDEQVAQRIGALYSQLSQVAGA